MKTKHINDYFVGSSPVQPRDKIVCRLCGVVCDMQITRTHLKKVHEMTTKEYKALGYETLSPARLEQLRNSPIGKRFVTGASGKFGKEHPNWKGGHTNGQGYRIVYRNGKRIPEHRAVAMDILGRDLFSDEVVHHKDGNRSNNTPDNLVVMKRSEHDKIKDKTKEYFHTNEHSVQAARHLYKDGWSISKIRHALRVSYSTIKRWLKSD